MAIVTRVGKGSKLTAKEMDNNLLSLETDISGNVSAITSKLDKGSYTGTAKDLENAIVAAVTGASGISIVPTSAAPSGTGIASFTATQAGTYTNYGGVVVAANSFAIISRSAAGAFSISQTALDLSSYAKVVDLAKKADLVASKNKYNYLGGDTITGFYLLSNGDISANSTYSISGYISIVVGKAYFCNRFNYPGGASYVFYDVNKVFISSSAGLGTVAPSNAVYLRYSINISTLLSTVQIEEGSVATTFVAYSSFVAESQLNLSAYTKTIDLSQLPVNGAKLINSSVTAEKTDFFSSTSQNLYNPNDADVVLGFYLSTTGLPVVANSGYNTTGFMPVNQGDVIVVGNNGNSFGARFIYGYDASKVKIDGSEDINRTTYTVPANVNFVRVSFQTINTLFQVNKTVIKTYSTYLFVRTLLPEYKTLDDNSVSSDKIQNGAVTEDKTIMFNASKNLFNPLEAVFGFYVDSTNGFAPLNTAYNATGFIPVIAGQNYTLSYKHQIAWYNASKVYISGSSSGDTIKTQLAPTGAVFLRCSINLVSYSSFQVELGSSQTSYLAFGYTLKKVYIEEYLSSIESEKYESLLGKEGKIISQASLTSGNIIEITDFPNFLKKGLSMSFYTDLTLAGSVSFGKGFAKYRGEYFTIDNTNVYYYADSVLTATKAHGLTISTFLKSSFSTDDNGVANFILQSLGGYFKTTFQMGNEMNFEPFIRTEGQTINSIKLTATSKDFQKSVWAFGDSYFGIGANRWPGSMKTFGYFNFLINGLAGQGSAAAYVDLLKCLKYGTPKYIVWCLGMNDGDSTYTSNLTSLIGTCAAKKITLILSTVPTVPSRDKEVIKSAVLASGYRYIDFYKAMGANSSGVWYSGYLNSDGVHPNQIGADALALQVLIDFPELMQYGKNL
jgi:hypothetical protein